MDFCCVRQCFPTAKNDNQLSTSVSFNNTTGACCTLDYDQREEKGSLINKPDVISQQPFSNGATGPHGVSQTKTHSHPLSLNTLVEYVRLSVQNGALRREHDLLPKGQLHPMERASDLEVREKNRYLKLPAYDHTRVILDSIPKIPGSDYINANYVDGYNKKRAYIATQGPKENTCSDFWRMVWQEHVSQIVMLTNIIEVGKKKCEKYWPDAILTADSITVTLEKTEVSADYTIRFFRLKKTDSTIVHHVRQYHYTSWPDHGVPLYPSVLIAFIKKIKSDPVPSDSGPIIVHCSAGIGRTGTVILIDSMIEMGRAENKIDILHHLYQMRQQRISILDNPDQYEFVHTALVEALLIDATCIPSSDFLRYYLQVCRGETAKKAELHRQYTILDSYRPMQKPRNTRAALDPINLSKNRSPQILPDERHRVFLKVIDGYTSDYINAVYVSGYKQKDSFIATQFPLPDTVIDFWRLVIDKNCPLVIVLNGITIDQDFEKFWPQDNTQFFVDDIQIIFDNVVEDNNVLIHSLRIKSSRRDMIETRSLILLHFPIWQHENIIPPSPSKFVRLLELAFHYRLTLQTGPTLVTCYDGSSSSGIFCSLAFACEKIKVEQEVDIFTAVRSVRCNRPNFISNIDQYLFCYEGVKSFLEAFSIYANFQ